MVETPQLDPDRDPELLAAISRAARHLGVPEGPGEAAGARPTIRFAAYSGGRRRLLVLAGTLAVVVGLSGYLSLRPSGGPPLVQQEEDLRWAVAHVVRRVEAIRLRTGHLPTNEDLHGLVSDLVVYEVVGDGYWVVGERGKVRVQYDDSVPLDVWLGQARQFGEGVPR